MSEVTDDFLAHYGVKGMQWGKRSAAPQTRKQKRQAHDFEVLSARQRQRSRERKYEEAQGDFMVARTAKGQDKAEKIMRKMEKDYFTHPDAATAQKLTTGEKRAVGIAYGAMGLMAVSLIAASATSRY